MRFHFSDFVEVAPINNPQKNFKSVINGCRQMSIYDKFF